MRRCRILRRGPLKAETGTAETGAATHFSSSRLLWAVLLSSVFLCFAGCGYRVAGRATRLPAQVRVIAVPALENASNEYRIEQRLTEAVIRELLARTRYRVVSDPNGADAVLHGRITSLYSAALVYDSAANRITMMLVTLRMQAWLEDGQTHKMLYQNRDFLFREPYEISTDTTVFFEEREPALERMSRDFAARLVSAVLENF